MNVTSYLQQRETGVSTRNDFRAKDTLIAILEEQAATPIKNQACELQGQPRATFLMDFSPDGTQVASTHGDHTVRVSNIATGKCTHVLTGHPRTPWCVGFHPSSNEILASGCLGGEVRIWDLLGGGSEVWHSPSNGVIASLSFHPLDHVLVFATGNTIYFWDWSQPEPFAFCKTNYDFERIRWLRFDPLGHFLYTGIANNTTVHRQEPSNVVHINEGGTHNPNMIQQFVNRRRYQQVIQQFHDYQEERPNVSEGNENLTDEAPQSPVHEEGLDYARQYADHVTDTTGRSIQQAREYAASVTQPVLHRPLHVEGRVVFHCPQPGRWSELPRGTWSPPPREAAVDDDVNDVIEVGALVPEQSLTSNSDAPSSTSGRRMLLNAQPHVTLRPQRPTFTTTSEFFTNIRSRITESRDSRSSNLPPVNTGIHWINSSHKSDNSNTSQNSENSTGNSVGSSVCNNSTGSRDDGNSVGSSVCNNSTGSRNDGNSVGSSVCNNSTGSRDGSNSVGSSVCINSSKTPSSTGSQCSVNLNNLPGSPFTSGTGALGQTRNTNVTGLFDQRSSCPDNSSRTPGSNRPSSAFHIPLSRIRSQVVVQPNPVRQSCATHSTDSPSVHSSCEICRSFNLRLLDSRSFTSTAPSNSGNRVNSLRLLDSRSFTSTAPSNSGNRVNNLRLLDSRSFTSTAPSNSGNRVNWAPSTSSSSRPHILSRPYMFSRHRRLFALSQARHSPYPRARPRIRTSDGMSQTSGAMVLPECSDQGTDVAGLTESVVDDVPVDLDDVEVADSSEDNADMSVSSELLRPCDNESETTEESVGSGSTDGGLSLQIRNESLTDLTLRLERQVSELDRRISALRENFTERLRVLHQDRERIMSQISQPSDDVVTSGQPSQHVPLITITRPQDHGNFSHTPTAYDNTTNSSNPNVQNPHLLEMFLRGDGHPPLPSSISRLRTQPSRGEAHEERSWHALQQRHLHPHYSVSILDETINRPNDALQAAINRAIAGAFMGTGEPAVASNIIPQTHRIQRWDFTRCEIPDITQAKHNIVVSHCKLHNDASCDISQDGTFLATFVPSHRGFPDNNILAVYSLHADSFAQCLFTKSFGPNAISVSLSPHNQCVMVGLAAKRLSWMFTPNQLVAQVYKLAEKNAGENSMKHLCDVFHPCDSDVRTHVSINSARWLRGPGEGLVYGTNRGDLHICRPGVKKSTNCDPNENADSEGSRSSIRRNLITVLGTRANNRSTIATQTISRGIRRTAETQTDAQTDQQTEQITEHEIMV